MLSEFKHGNCIFRLDERKMALHVFVGPAEDDGELICMARREPMQIDPRASAENNGTSREITQR